MSMDFRRGKEILQLNFGSKYFMQKNGEYTEYLRCNIPKDIEIEWIEEIKQSLIVKIINEEDVGLIWNLSYIDIPYEEKLLVFKKVILEGNKKAIMDKMILLKELFDRDFYQEVVSLFS